MPVDWQSGLRCLAVCLVVEQLAVPWQIAAASDATSNAAPLSESCFFADANSNVIVDSEPSANHNPIASAHIDRTAADSRNTGAVIAIADPETSTGNAQTADARFDVNATGKVVNSANAPSASTASTFASANLDETNKQISSATERVLKKLIEIQRLNTLFRSESTKQPRLRQWRQSLYVETNSGCTMGGTADAMALHYPNIHRPATFFEVDKKVSSTGAVKFFLTSHVADPRRVRPAFSQGIQEPQVVGNCVNIAGDIFELGANATRYLELKKLGLGCSGFRKRILALRDEVDTMISARDSLVRSLPPGTPELAMALAEGRLLRDFRDIIMIEYTQFHSSAIRLYWFQNAAYVLDFAKNSTGAIGGIISIEGSHLRRARWGGTAGLFTTISGVLILVIPLAGRVAGNLAGTVDRRTVTRDFGASIASNTDDAVRDFLALKRLTRVPTSGSDAAVSAAAMGLHPEYSTRLRIYEGLCLMMRSHETNIERYLRQAKRATIENVIYGSTVGSTKVTLGICGMLAGWRYYTKPWIASQLLAAGNTAYGSGTGFSIFENTRVLTTHLIDENRQRSENMLPGQIYRARLSTLDEMAGSLNLTESRNR